jgi:ribokinase
MKNVFVVGSSNTDMIIRVPHIPSPGETILGGEFSMAAGGKGANQAVAAARAGGRVTFLARVGDDFFGAEALKNLKADGINARFVLRDRRAASGVALINVGENGENSISVASGANALLAPEDVLRAEKALKGADIVLVQLETPVETVRAAAELASMRGIPIILNPAPARPLGDDLLKSVEIITPNEHEAELLTGLRVVSEADARNAAARLRQRGPKLAIITLGERGCYASGDGFEGAVPAFKVRPADTTAAGDVFNGALAVALAERRPVPEALRFASGAAALSVTRHGAQPSAPMRREIEDFLALNA